ncbi:hypothetical protein [Butyrivibrio hungatei]|uniref:Uncharacterized protein n=1 Tax=Butyrivibrio hungatei TaxID=185008 RepID=A0A1D9P5F8_9FIRM|nr:hypothetical protein [Butyrivibrio hungatei]AOZ97817.1 hypothetical protein bhn_II018 [Butyrivibrio hungatei]
MNNKNPQHPLLKSVLKALMIIIVTSTVCYVLLQTNKHFLHVKNDYEGYEYYSSIFIDKNSAAYHPEKDIEDFLKEYPDYVYILDEFYQDGFSLIYESPMTYKILNPSKDYTPLAHLGINKITKKPIVGIRINTVEDQFTPHTIMHELGHYIDSCLGFPSQSEEFKKILKEEHNSSNITNDYYFAPREYFAEEFADYVTYMQKGKSIELFSRETDTQVECPKTFDYIEKILNTFTYE